MPTYLHSRDIDVMARKDHPYRTDDAGLIAVVGDQDVAGQGAVERESINFHDGGILPVPNDRNVVGKRSIIGPNDFKGEVRQPRGISVAADDAYPDAVFFCQQSGVDRRDSLVSPTL